MPKKGSMRKAYLSEIQSQTNEHNHNLSGLSFISLHARSSLGYAKADYI